MGGVVVVTVHRNVLERDTGRVKYRPGLNWTSGIFYLGSKASNAPST